MVHRDADLLVDVLVMKHVVPVAARSMLTTQQSRYNSINNMKHSLQVMSQWKEENALAEPKAEVASNK